VGPGGGVRIISRHPEERKKRRKAKERTFIFIERNGDIIYHPLIYKNIKVTTKRGLPFVLKNDDCLYLLF